MFGRISDLTEPCICKINVFFRPSDVWSQSNFIDNICNLKEYTGLLGIGICHWQFHLTQCEWNGYLPIWHNQLSSWCRQFQQDIVIVNIRRCCCTGLGGNMVLGWVLLPGLKESLKYVININLDSSSCSAKLECAGNWPKIQYEAALSFNYHANYSTCFSIPYSLIWVIFHIPGNCVCTI